MTIQLDEPQGPRIPVVKRTAIGEHFRGCLVNKAQRPILRDGAEVLNDKGNPRQELVLTLLAMPGTTSPAGIGDHQEVPAAGDLVRLILRGRAYSQWIEQTKSRRTCVGDIVTQDTQTAQVYDASGRPEGRELTTQAEVDAVPRSKTLGIYGPLTVTSATPAEAEWVARAEAQYRDTTAVVLQPAGIAVEDIL